MARLASSWPLESSGTGRSWPQGGSWRRAKPRAKLEIYRQEASWPTCGSWPTSRRQRSPKATSVSRRRLRRRLRGRHRRGSANSCGRRQLRRGLPRSRADHQRKRVRASTASPSCATSRARARDQITVAAWQPSYSGSSRRWISMATWIKPGQPRRLDRVAQGVCRRRSRSPGRLTGHQPFTAPALNATRSLRSHLTIAPRRNITGVSRPRPRPSVALTQPRYGAYPPPGSPVEVRLLTSMT